MGRDAGFGEGDVVPLRFERGLREPKTQVRARFFVGCITYVHSSLKRKEGERKRGLLYKYLLTTDYVNTSGEVLSSISSLNALLDELTVDAVNVNY